MSKIIYASACAFPESETDKLSPCNFIHYCQGASGILRFLYPHDEALNYIRYKKFGDFYIRGFLLFGSENGFWT